jgi:hypothetical protein
MLLDCLIFIGVVLVILVSLGNLVGYLRED